jgi:hypothetical protein
LPNLHDDGVVLPSEVAVSEGALIVAPFFDDKHLTLLTITAGGGVNKTEAEVAAADANVREISFATPRSGWILTNNYRLLSTTDGGATWKWLVPGDSLRDLPPAPPPSHLTPLKKLGLGPVLPPPGRPPQLRDETPAESPPLSPLLYVAAHLGFDQQHVTTPANMQIWFDWSPFSDVGFYVGGANYCYQYNPKTKTCTTRLDPGVKLSWVNAVQGQGWGFMPIWVGLQAPCNTGNVSLFSSVPATAQTQGATEADNASTAMTALGLSGTVVFYDMENYTASARSSCSLAVRAFLTGWVSEMNKDGYQTTAVYGNPVPAQRDFSTVPGLNQVWITATPVAEKPPAPGGPPRVTIWGLGTGSGALDDNLWSYNQRAHQFLIDIAAVTYGSYKSPNGIDYDVVDLQIPGGNGHKAYAIPTPTTISYPGSLNNAAGGINDVRPDTIGTPLFITGTQTGQIVGSWNSGGTGGSYMFGAATGFIDNSGALTLLTNSQWPDQNFNMGLNDVGYAVGFTGGDAFQNYIAANAYTLIYGPADAVAGVSLNAINDDNQAVGSYYVNPTGSGNYSLGMIYENGGAYNVSPGCPGESSDGTGGSTFIYGINGYGQMVGHYASPDFTQVHGFLYSDGVCTLVDVPGGVLGFTWPYGINNNGQIVGSYSNGSTILGFMLDGAVYYSFGYSGGGTTVEVVPNSVNDASQIVGYALLSSGCPPYSCDAAFEYGLVPIQ